MSGDLLTFLERFRPDEYTTFVAIVPDGRVDAATFNGADPTATADWITRHNRTQGCYFTVNPTLAHLRDKPRKEHITAIAAVWADIDPRDDQGQPLAQERDRLLALADELQGLAQPPTLTIDSGSGLQPVWLLADPIDATPEYRDAADALCARVEAALGAKGTHNCDRVLRVPGTINYPNKKKQRLGRSETHARLLHASWRRYCWRDLESLAAHLEQQPPKHAVRIAEQPRDGPRKALRPEELDELRRSLAGDSPSGWLTAMLKMIGRLVHDGATDWFIKDWALQYRWPEYSEEQTLREIEPMIRGARKKGFAPADDWAEPLDVIGAPELVGWPELTGECLPPALYRYVMSEAERLNVDPCPLAAHVLAACATSISDAWRIRPKRHDPWTQQGRLWVCVVKEVGARGTEMLRSAFWPVRQREDELREQWQREHAAWKARQAERKVKKDQDQEDDPEPKCRRLTSQDATIEAASEILAAGDATSKLTLQCDELVAFLGGFGRYTPNGSAARALWLEAYDGGPQRIDRIKRGQVYVANWSICIAGNIQPRRLAGMAKDLIDDGLFQRFFVVHTKPAALGADDDAPLSLDAGRDYRDLHEALAALEPVRNADGHPATVYVDAVGHEERRRLMRLVERLQVDPTLPTIIRETAPKWSGLLARLTLIFHLAETAERRRQGELVEPRDLCCVTGPTVTMAATFLRRIALPNLFRLGFETLPEEGAPAAHARWLAGYILAHQSGAITAREIGRAYRPLRGKPLETMQAVDVLCDAAWAVPAEGRHDGARWNVNPAVHTRFAPAAALEKQRRASALEAIRTAITDL